MNGRYILVGLMVALLSVRVFSAESISAKDMSERIVGSWIVPPDSTDYSAHNAYSMESFKSDGTYTFYVFRDAECKVAVQEIRVKWTIEGHVLISTLPDGNKVRDEIINIDNDRMTLHSLDDGTTYTRVRALTCSKAQIS
jgi:hypothetical protein